MRKRLFLFLLVFLWLFLFSPLIFLQKSAVLAVSIWPNNGTGLTCEQICQQHSQHCFGAGTDAGATNSYYMRHWVDRKEETEGCDNTELGSSLSAQCNYGMPYQQGNICSGRTASWTNCRCAPRYVVPNNYTGTTCSTMCGGADKCITIGTDSNASNGSLVDIWLCGQQCTECGDVDGTCATNIQHKTVVGQDYCGDRTVRWTNCWCTGYVAPPTPTPMCPNYVNGYVDPLQVVADGQSYIYSYCNYGTTAVSSCMFTGTLPYQGYGGCTDMGFTGTTKKWKCQVWGPPGSFQSTCMLYDGDGAWNCCNKTNVSGAFTVITPSPTRRPDPPTPTLTLVPTTTRTPTPTATRTPTPTVCRGCGSECYTPGQCCSGQCVDGFCACPPSITITPTRTRTPTPTPTVDCSCAGADNCIGKVPPCNGLSCVAGECNPSVIPTKTITPTRTRTPTPTRTLTPTPTRTPSPQGPSPTVTITPTPYYYRCNDSACERVSGGRQIPPYYTDCQGQSALWCSVCNNLICQGSTDCSSQDGSSCSICSVGACLSPSPTPTITLVPSPTITITPSPTVTRTPTPTPTVTVTPTITLTPTPTNNQVYGWIYRETNNDSLDRTSPPSEGLLSGYVIRLSEISETSSQGTPISGLLGNYLFSSLNNGVYQILVQATPTGSVLYSVPGQEHTNPQIAVINGNDSIVDFPFVTVTPIGAVSPTSTPSTTPIVLSPTSQPTPTSLWSPTPSVGPGTPSMTPIPCQTLPTPVLSAPAHELCTASKPPFTAYVKNPNNDNVWAKFYSNSFEKFEAAGSTQPSSGGDSTWSPYEAALNSTGSYWWTAYAESSSCPRSNDAPALLVNMDHTAPPKPTAPTCTLVSQDLISGLCYFNCVWPADPESAGASCADTDDYHPVYTNSPGPGSWDPGWVGNQLSQDIYNVPDGQSLIAKVQARDSVNNESLYSDDGAAAVCPKIIFAPTSTPGGPTATITPNPTGTLTPTPLVSPTPGDWVKIYGGDVYQSAVSQPALPAGNYYLDNLILNPNSVGVIISNSGASGLDVRSSPKRWESAGNISNAYSFSYYWEALKDKAKSITKSVGNNTVGTPADLNESDNVYTYTQWGHYILDSTFNGRVNGTADTTIFLISGSLEITSNFTLADFTDTVIFVVNGNIYIGGDVTSIPGLYISSQTFTVAAGSERIIIEGMVYAKNLSLHRTYRDLVNPTYQIVYQPKYVIALLPYFGRVKVNWQEVTP